jgi:hypothetical protein
LELLDDTGLVADADQAKLGAALVPIRDLLQAGLFQVVGEGDLVAGGGGAGEDVAAGVGDAGELAGVAEWFGEFNDGPRWR